MGIGERLDAWKALGVITEAQHATLTALVRRERFSVFVELSALLYLGVLSFVGGLAWTFRDYVQNLGDAAILGILTLLLAVSFGYCISKAVPYAHGEVESPSLAYDYVLYFGCLIVATTLAFIETRFGVFHGWDTQLLLSALLFGGLAYRFDNRFVLSLALSSLAGYLGLRLSLFETWSSDALRVSALSYGAFLLGVGVLLLRARIKPHFFDVYLQLGTNAVLLATLSGVHESGTGSWFLLALLVLAGIAIALGIQHRRFALVAYGTLYGYAGITIRVLEWLGDALASLAYFVVTGALVVLGLVLIARRWGRDE